MNNIDCSQKSKTETLPKQQEAAKEYLGGDFTLNPKGTDKFYQEWQGNKFNEKISLNDISKIGDLDKLAEWTDAHSFNFSYCLHRIMDNSYKFLCEDLAPEQREEIILNLLEWNKGLGRNEKWAQNQYFDGERTIIKRLAQRSLLTKNIIDWLIAERRNDLTIWELMEINPKLLTPGQIKEIVINSKNCFLKYQLIEKGYVYIYDSAEARERAKKWHGEEKIKFEYTPEEIEKLYFNVDDKDESKWILYDRIVDYLLPNMDENSRKEFVAKALQDVIYGYKKILKESKAEGAIRSAGVSEGNYDKARDEQEKEIWFPQSLPRLISAITRHYKYLSDEQLIELIKNCPSLCSGEGLDVDYHPGYLPGWVFKGLLLRWGKHSDTYEKNAIRDFNKPEYKEKYTLMEKMFSKEPPISEILTEKEQMEIMEEVKDCGYKLFQPIYPAGPEEKEIVLFEHISGVPGLKYLVPTRSRGTDRFLRDYGIYLQKGGMDTWQISHLKEINKGKLYKYYISLPKKLLEDYAVHRDDRWEGGFITKRPIFLDRNPELTWDMFNPLMKMEAFSHYERIFGPIPNEIKNKLMEGGTKTDADL